MSAKNLTIRREEYNLTAKSRGIQKAHKNSKDALIKVLDAKKYLFRKGHNLIAEKRGIKEPHMMSTKDLLNALHTLYKRIIKHKSYSTCRKFKKLGLDKHTKKQCIRKRFM